MSVKIVLSHDIHDNGNEKLEFKENSLIGEK